MFPIYPPGSAVNDEADFIRRKALRFSALRVLYMPGMVALRYNPAIKALGERLRASGLAPKAVIGAAMRKLAHLILRRGQLRKTFRCQPGYAQA